MARRLVAREACSRRDFLSTVSLAATGMMVGAHRLTRAAVPPGIAPRALLPDALDPALLASLATRAIDAARSAGAKYADVRVGEFQTCALAKGQEDLDFAVWLEARCSYGVRALVDGCWGFAHGSEPSVDAITATARTAVVQAQLSARMPGARLDFVAAPVVTGSWQTPMEIDPFTVPLHEQMAHLNEWSIVPAARVESAEFQWRREVRVFASTEGSLITQTFHRSLPSQDVHGGGPGWYVSYPVRGVGPTNGGYETVLRPSHEDDIRATIERLRPFQSLPSGPLPVGRYPVVFDGVGLGALTYVTVGQALEMDRALGDEADASGTSYLAPVDSQIGVPMFPTLLTVTTDRAMPSVTAVKWDDEGVEPVRGAVIDGGRVVDYETSRGTAGALTSWYERQKLLLASRGCAVATDANRPVEVRCGHLTVRPSAQRASLDELFREMGHGLYVVGGGVATDHQLASAAGFGHLFEIVGGKLTRYVSSKLLMQWQTVPFWKGLVALGDQGTMDDQYGRTSKGMPWRRWHYHATAPAALFKAVDVVNIALALNR